VGVVAEGANCYALSYAAGKAIATNTGTSFADGMAVRIPNAEALGIILEGADRIVTVCEDEIAEAVRLYFRCCHTIAEGAGAAPLAALMQERGKMGGKRVGVILSGGNIDMPKFAEVLQGRTPAP
jgi:threonine dehydratase